MNGFRAGARRRSPGFARSAVALTGTRRANGKPPMRIFRAAISATLAKADCSLTWTELRTVAGLPQLFPNNQWVHKLERDIGLMRGRDAHGIVHWQLKVNAGAGLNESTVKITDETSARARRKQGAME